MINKLKAFWRWLNNPGCYKTSMGYNCHHRVYDDGSKECGGRDE